MANKMCRNALCSLLASDKYPLLITAWQLCSLLLEYAVSGVPYYFNVHVRMCSTLLKLLLTVQIFLRSVTIRTRSLPEGRGTKQKCSYLTGRYDTLMMLTG
jgi:hypothetical protein